MEVIIFRGRSTDGIRRDALLNWPEATISVVAEEGDALRQEGDISVREAAIRLVGTTGLPVVVANGGTTMPPLRLMALLADARARCQSEPLGVRFVNLQRDGLEEIGVI